jgi:flagellar FliJ protein
MKSFQFRLQKYLDLKRQEEKMCRLLLAEAQAAYDRELERLKQVGERIAALTGYGRQMRSQRLEVGQLVLLETFLTTLAEERERQAGMVAAALERLDETRESYLAVQRERKLLERVRDSRWHNYYQELLSEEQKELDEIGTIGFHRAGGRHS